jgi:hypothetical protein
MPVYVNDPMTYQQFQQTQQQLQSIQPGNNSINMTAMNENLAQQQLQLSQQNCGNINCSHCKN